jgi:hypothetical protein
MADVSTQLLVSKTWRDTALDIITEQDRGVWLLTFPRTSPSPAHRGGADDSITGPGAEPGKPNASFPGKISRLG